MAEVSSEAMRFDEVLRTFAEFFEREGVRYAIAGGLALHAWGFSRTTQDVDFIVDGNNRDRVIGFVESLGYRTRHISPGYSNHEHASADFGHIDFIYVYGATADELFAHARKRLATPTVEAPVPRPEHLIAMKVRAIRDRAHRQFIDLPDIEYLLSLPNVDRVMVREYFARAGLLRIFDVIEKERGA